MDLLRATYELFGDSHQKDDDIYIGSFGNAVKATQEQLDDIAIKAKEIFESGLKTKKLKELKQQCANQITTGFTSNALGSEHTYQSEQIDQLNLIAVVTAGTNDVFKCSPDNGATWSYLPHTLAQLQQILADGKATKQTALARYEQLKAGVNLVTTQDELDLINW